MYVTFPKFPFKINSGINIPGRKNTAHKNSTTMLFPKKVILPMSQHIGVPCKPCVKKGDIVKIGDVVGEMQAYVSAPIHASISGEVSGITEISLPNVGKVQAVVIESDGKMRMSDSISIPTVNNSNDLVNEVKKSGLVGLGGAGFPSHVKLSIPKEKNVDTLIINAAECEPYVTSDHVEALKNSEELFSGIYIIKKLLNIDKVIIAVEDNKPDVIRKFERIISNKKVDIAHKVQVLKLESKYPGGAEKVLIRFCTGREIPSGKLPLDVGCLIMNITTVSFLALYLKTGIPLVSKRITVDGSAIKNPQNVIVPIGTPISDVVDFCGGYKCEPGKILMGGPMMGLAVVSDELPILKQNNAIIALNEKDSLLPEPTACIRCGRCIQNCPMHLMPTLLEKAVKKRNINALKKYNVMTCMECGCCVYNCPAGRQLVQSIRLGKALLKAEEKR